MRREPTLAERKLWALLRGRRLAGLEFRRQVPLGDYIDAFACFKPKLKLVVEADSARHPLPEAYDAARDAWLAEQTFTVLRFSNRGAVFEPEVVIRRIREAAGFPVGPSPHAGEGVREADG